MPNVVATSTRAGWADHASSSSRYCVGELEPSRDLVAVPPRFGDRIPTGTEPHQRRGTGEHVDVDGAVRDRVGTAATRRRGRVRCRRAAAPRCARARTRRLRRSRAEPTGVPSSSAGASVTRTVTDTPSGTTSGSSNVTDPTVAVPPAELRRREVELEVTGARQHGDAVGRAVLVDQPVVGGRQRADEVGVAAAVDGQLRQHRMGDRLAGLESRAELGAPPWRRARARCRS